jgi:hypothetical protein
MLTQVSNLWASKRLGPIRQKEAKVFAFVTHAHNNLGFFVLFGCLLCVVNAVILDCLL